MDSVFNFPQPLTFNLQKSQNVYALITYKNLPSTLVLISMIHPLNLF